MHATTEEALDSHQQEASRTEESVDFVLVFESNLSKPRQNFQSGLIVEAERNRYALEKAKNEAEASRTRTPLFWVFAILSIVGITLVMLWAIGVIPIDQTQQSKSSAASISPPELVRPPEPQVVPSLPDPNMGVSSHAGLLRSLLPPATQARMKDRQSAQFRAYDWLSHDLRLSNYTRARLLQRYALATLYFAGNADDNDVVLLDYPPDECEVKQIGTTDDSTPILEDHPSERARTMAHRGTACNAEGQYVTLSLPWRLPSSTNGTTSTSTLKGTLPEEIFTLLPYLENILVSGHAELTGTLSSHIGRLTHLKGLYLDRCHFTGTLPTEVGLLTNLTELWINNNQFNGTTVPLEPLRDTLVQWDLTHNSFSDETWTRMVEPNNRTGF